MSYNQDSMHCLPKEWVVIANTPSDTHQSDIWNEIPSNNLMNLFSPLKVTQNYKNTPFDFTPVIPTKQKVQVNRRKRIRKRKKKGEEGIY